MAPVLLIHGGLGDDMTAAEFWERPGIAPGLRAAGLEVIAPDRDTSPESWTTAAANVGRAMTQPCSVVAGSNGVSVALRLAIDSPSLVERLVLTWPATAGDGRVDALAPPHVRQLLTGQTVRGVTDDDLATISVPTWIVASDPPNPFHAQETAERLGALLPDATLLPNGFPESPRPDFPDRCVEFVDTIVPLLRDGISR